MYLIVSLICCPMDIGNNALRISEDRVINSESPIATLIRNQDDECVIAAMPVLIWFSVAPIPVN